MTEHDTRVRPGSWAGLAAEGSRLQALYQQGRLDEVLAAVTEHHATMATLPDASDTGNDTVPAWAVRESILSLGVVAAHDLGRWPQALELNAAIRQSQENRSAAEAERAVTWFNDYGPLLRLGRAREARELLYKCRAAFGRAENVTMMGNTLSALADADAHLGNLERAVAQETNALQIKYRGSDPEAIAVSHYNLANYLQAGQESRAVWAHRLAAAIIRYQTESPRLTTSLQSIGRLVGQQAEAAAPLSFNDVCLVVDSLPEVRFAELFATLPDRVDSGQAAVDEIMRLTADVRDSAIQESVAAWEPIISALVAARQPDAGEAAALLEDALTELGKHHAWQELVAVLRQIQAGPDDYSSRAVDSLDPVSASIAGRARAALAGSVTVDSTAWRVLTEEA
jgi:tetratricopeptide (TPR) repeat protein